MLLKNYKMLLKLLQSPFDKNRVKGIHMRLATSAAKERGGRRLHASTVTCTAALFSLVPGSSGPELIDFALLLG